MRLICICNIKFDQNQVIIAAMKKWWMTTYLRRSWLSPIILVSHWNYSYCLTCRYRQGNQSCKASANLSRKIKSLSVEKSKRDLIKDCKKPVVLFVDVTHDLHHIALAEYSGLIFVSLLGVAWLGEYPDGLTLVDILLIVLGHRRNRQNVKP